MYRTFAGHWRRNTLVLGLTVLVGLSMAGASRISPATAAGEPFSITAPDSIGDVGQYTSLVLDSAGNPVVSYYDVANSDLKLLRCNDPNCAGGDESITSPDTAGSVGSHTSLVLDASGNPVISYYDATNSQLKLLHCNDPNCSGGDESITAPDGFASLYTSLVLDGGGNPVVSYYDATNSQLKLLHCNDPNCAGGDESITTPDPGSHGVYTSLVLDGSGNPMVSYHSNATGRLTLLHCNDADCAGGDESITIPDPGSLGFYTSLVLDGSGNPVMTFLVEDATLGLVHCNDQNCAGGDESVSRPNSNTFTNIFTPPSLVLDAAGNPVVSYYHPDGCDIGCFIPQTGVLKLLHCNDPNCVGDDETITTPETPGAGLYPSLALDGDGNPVVSYFDDTNGDLNLLHCNEPNCAKAPPTPTPCPSGKVPSSAGGCGTPTPSLTPEMLLNIKGGDCNDNERPTTCDVLTGGQFLLSVDALTVPSSGYITMQTFVDFGANLTYKPSDLATQEILWPDCQSATALRSQLDQTLPVPPGALFNSDEVVGHGCLTGLIPPIPESHYVGNLVEFILTCSTGPSSNLVKLLPYTQSPDAVAGTSGALFVQSDASQTVPLVGSLTINCVDAAPAAVGGVALGGELQGISARDGNAPWLWAALGLGLIAATSAVTIARRRRAVSG